MHRKQALPVEEEMQKTSYLEYKILREDLSVTLKKHCSLLKLKQPIFYLNSENSHSLQGNGDCFKRFKEIHPNQRHPHLLPFSQNLHMFHLVQP